MFYRDVSCVFYSKKEPEPKHNDPGQTPIPPDLAHPWVQHTNHWVTWLG